MPSLPRIRRRDPRWQEEGPAARREQRLERLRAMLAFAASLVAVVGAGVAWVVRLGIAGIGRG